MRAAHASGRTLAVVPNPVEEAAAVRFRKTQSLNFLDFVLLTVIIIKALRPDKGGIPRPTPTRMTGFRRKHSNIMLNRVRINSGTPGSGSSPLNSSRAKAPAINIVQHISLGA